MPLDQIALRVHDEETVGQDVFAEADRFMHGAIAHLTGGRSPWFAAEAWFSWLAHLVLSPGKQADLWLQACSAILRSHELLAETHPDSSRFAAACWNLWPYNVLAATHRASEAWWQSATSGVRGVSARHQHVITSEMTQMLQALSPANFALTNPEIQRTAQASGGFNLMEGFQRILSTATGVNSTVDDQHVVGKTLAITPGKVIFRNRLIELIQYEPATDSVYAEPVLIVPAWIMKYYILDLRPENSMIRYLVGQGHTVFAISWRNPGPEDRDLTMDDYRRLGIMAAVDAIGQSRPDRRIHACGYCLGGTMLAIAAATMARDGDARLASMTLLAAQTDFTEPGELKLFIDDTELTWLDSLMAQNGGLTGAQMGAAFQMLRAEELIWLPFVRRYLLAETDHPSDLMAWNADQTRMPHRMHSEYLRRLFLDNALARSQYVVMDRPIALRDIDVPVFALGTLKDHVAPWRSAYKITLLTRSEVTFVLASGGHNAGVVSEPGHKGRTYRLLSMPAGQSYIDADGYLALAEHHEGSWWPAWQFWLAERSSERIAPPEIRQSVCDAPGTYVLAT